MGVDLKPTTTLGTWSAWLIVASAISLASLGILVLSGHVVALLILFVAMSGIAAFITGLISIVKRKERSIAVYLAVTFGLVVLFFWLRLITFPH